MTNIRSAVPASLRTPAEGTRFARTLMSRAVRPVLVAGPEARAAALAKSRFSRLPHESEDAKITGTTRSLHRRLLALNLHGSLMRRPMRMEAKIA